MNGYTVVRMRGDELIGEAERVRMVSAGLAAAPRPRAAARLRRAAGGWRHRLVGAQHAAGPGGRGRAPVASGHRAAGGRLVAGEAAGRTR